LLIEDGVVATTASLVGRYSRVAVREAGTADRPSHADKAAAVLCGSPRLAKLVDML
jgi:hypothetical protein